MSTVMTDVFAVFTAVAGWFVDAIELLIPLFYVVGEGLTFIGVLSVASLAVALVLLILAVIRSYLQWRA